MFSIFVRNFSRLPELPQIVFTHNRPIVLTIGFLAFFVFFSIPRATAQTPDPIVSTPDTSPQTSDKLIHFGDLIDVDVLGSLEYDWRGTITPEGFLDGLDRIPKQIYALCRSEESLADEIAAELSRTLRDPKVVVRILDRSNRPHATLNGAIRSPTRFSIRREVRLNELVIVAGGFLDTASGEIEIIRPADLSCFSKADKPPELVNVSQSNSPRVMTIRISDLLKGDEDANPIILSGDSINAGQAFPVFVVGGVNNPGRIGSRTTLSVSRAIASAGGLSKEANEGEVTIFRRDAAGPAVLTADLAKIAQGEANDVLLKPFDVVDVPAKGRSKSKFPQLPTIPADSVAPPELPLRIID